MFIIHFLFSNQPLLLKLQQLTKLITQRTSCCFTHISKPINPVVVNLFLKGTRTGNSSGLFQIALPFVHGFWLSLCLNVVRCRQKTTFCTWYISKKNKNNKHNETATSPWEWVQCEWLRGQYLVLVYFYFFHLNVLPALLAWAVFNMRKIKYYCVKDTVLIPWGGSCTDEGSLVWVTGPGQWISTECVSRRSFI